MLEKIDPDRHELQGLVIAPTRELAIQTQEELYRLGRDKKCVCKPSTVEQILAVRSVA